MPEATSETTLDRKTLIAALRTTLESDEAVRAAWLGGSDATGRRDAWSDIDVAVIARDEAVEAVFTRVEAALGALSPIELVYRVPSPTWHGHAQAFYRLRDAGPHLLVDFAVMALSSPPDRRFLEPERHGTAVALFDRDGLIAAPPFDRAAHLERMRSRLTALAQRFEMFQTMVVRSIERGLPADAAHFYHQFTFLPTVEALRMLHCPDRYDYGPRYLRDDLPADVCAAVERLALCGDLTTLRERREEAERLFRDAVARVNARGWNGRGGEA